MLALGTRIADYEIRRPLGRGGMGEVYEAMQQNPRRLVALKVLNSRLTGDADALERFWREAAVPAQLDHPSIVRIFAAGKTPEGIAYYTMQLVHGVSLDHLMQRISGSELDTTAAALDNIHKETPTETPAEPAKPEILAGEAPAAVVRDYQHDRFGFVARVGRPAAMALDHAHQQHHLHRDIKPSNLMIDRHHHVYLVDFGLTRALDGDGSLTKFGRIVGTPWYMSPEQALGEPYDHRSDIFSLGVTLYELATGGRGPYRCNRSDTPSVLDEVRSHAWLPIRELTPDVPPRLAAIIERAMDADPRKRFTSAAELARELERFEMEEADRSRETKPCLSMSEAFRRRDRRKVLIGLAGLAVTAAAAWPVAAYLFGDDEPPDEANAVYPLSYLNRKSGVLYPVCSPRARLIWSRKVLGGGSVNVVPDARTGSAVIQIWSRPELFPTLLMLDDDPKKRGFEVALELVRTRKAPPEHHQLGLFLGLKRTEKGEPEPDEPMLMLELTNSAQDPSERLLIGHALYAQGKGDRPHLVHPLTPLPGSKGEVSLRPNESYRSLKVRFLKDLVSITVDNNTFVNLRLNDLRPPGWSARDQFDPHGGLGIWAANGTGWFRNVRLAVLDQE